MESLRNRPRFFVKISSLPRFPHNFFHGRKSEISAQSARLKTRVGSYFVSFFLFFQPNTIRSIRTQFEKRKKKVGGETTTKNEKLLSSNSRYTFVAWWVFFNSRHARGRVPSKIAKGGEIFIDVFLQRPPVNRWWSRASQITGGWIIKKRGEGRERERGWVNKKWATFRWLRLVRLWMFMQIFWGTGENKQRIFRDIFEHYHWYYSGDYVLYSFYQLEFQRRV